MVYQLVWGAVGHSPLKCRLSQVETFDEERMHFAPGLPEQVLHPCSRCSKGAPSTQKDFLQLQQKYLEAFTIKNRGIRNVVITVGVRTLRRQHIYKRSVSLLLTLKKATLPFQTLMWLRVYLKLRVGRQGSEKWDFDGWSGLPWWLRQ